MRNLSYILDSIRNSDFSHAVKLINDNEDFGWEETLEGFAHVSISDLYAIHRGTCRQHTSWKVAALRSIGIPVADVNGNQSTSWAVIVDKNGESFGWEGYTPLGEGARYIDDQRYTNYPKIFKSTYKIQQLPFSDVDKPNIPPQFLNQNRVDITREQSDAANVTLELFTPTPKGTKYVFLCVFNKQSLTWQAVHWSKIKSNRGYFDQMGLGCIYLPMYYIEDQYIPAGNPIYLSKNSKIITLKSNAHKAKMCKIYRKADLNFWENRYADLMAHDVFEGSNKRDFKESKVLFEIINKPVRMENQDTGTEEIFQYVRYRSRLSEQIWKNSSLYRVKWDHLYLAEIAFLDDMGEPLTGKILTSSPSQRENAKKAFDNDIRTNFNSTSLCWIGLDLGRPTKVSKVKYLFQNSFNTVEPGDMYELLFWDKEWKSLGKKVAIKDYVEYKVPDNALLWLRNLTKGKEEQLFFMNGVEQVWE